MYYRVAIQLDPSPRWQRKSTVLSELSPLFQFLRPYTRSVAGLLLITGGPVGAVRAELGIPFGDGSTISTRANDSSTDGGAGYLSTGGRIGHDIRAGYR